MITSPLLLSVKENKYLEAAGFLCSSSGSFQTFSQFRPKKKRRDTERPGIRSLSETHRKTHKAPRVFRGLF
jgi:hypothetical protein